MYDFPYSVSVGISNYHLVNLIKSLTELLALIRIQSLLVIVCVSIGDILLHVSKGLHQSVDLSKRLRYQ